MKKNLIYPRIFLYIYFTFFFVLLKTVPIHAYLDPSVMTYAIQATAGVAIALGTVFGLYWNKLVRISRSKFHLPEKKKETETDELTFLDPANGMPFTYRDIDYVLESVPEKTATKPVKRTLRDRIRSFGKAMVPAVLLVIALAVMMTYYAPMEMFMTNQDEFWFSFSMVSPILWKLCFALIAFGIVAYFFAYLLWDRFFDVMLAFGTILFLILYVQGNYLAANMPPTDGTEIIWSEYRMDMMISAVLVLAAVVLVVLLIRFLKRENFYRFVSFVSVLVLIMLSVSFVSIDMKREKINKDYTPIVTNEYAFDMSSNKNFVILMLDATEGEMTAKVLEDDPEYKEAFKDFTFYPNTTTAYPYTSRAVPFILTGEWYENQEEYKKFEAKAMAASPLLKRLEEENFRIGMYEKNYLNDQNYERYDNVFMQKNTFNSEIQMMKMSIRLSLFKYSPFFMKRFFLTETNYFDGIRTPDTDHTIWLQDNDVFADLLKKSEVRIGEENCFRWLHIYGAHAPYQWTKDVKFLPEANGTYYQNVECAMTIAQRYVQKLKDAGVYDNSIIIIMSDHGYNYDKTRTGGDPSLSRQNALLMIKGLNEDNEEMQISQAPLSFADLQDAYQKLLDGKPGNAVFDVPEGIQRDRRILIFKYRKENHMEEYIQTGYASDNDTMVPTGKTYDYKE